MHGSPNSRLYKTDVNNDNDDDDDNNNDNDDDNNNNNNTCVAVQSLRYFKHS